MGYFVQAQLIWCFSVLWSSKQPRIHFPLHLQLQPQNFFLQSISDKYLEFTMNSMMENFPAFKLQLKLSGLSGEKLLNRIFFPFSSNCILKSEHVFMKNCCQRPRFAWFWLEHLCYTCIHKIECNVQISNSTQVNHRKDEIVFSS